MKKLLGPGKFKKIIIAVCLFFILMAAFGYIPQANIFAKCVLARTLQAALQVYDPLNDKTKQSLLQEPSIPDNFIYRRENLDEILEAFDVTILDYKNPRLRASSFKFYYQAYNEPKLKRLSARYNLPQFIRNPDFSGFLALKDWLRQRYAHGLPPKGLTFYNFDALGLLSQNEKNSTLDCGAFSYTYVQCILSIGGQARIVLLHSEESRGHVVSEVWSNDWGKWIVVDVDHNLYYELNGIPLNALELHKAFIKEDYADIKIIRGPPLKKAERRCTLEEELSKYFYFAVRMRNDFFNKYPRWHYKGNLYTNCVQWTDEETPKLLQYVYATGAEDDLYWDLNKTAVYFRPDKDFAQNKILNVYLKTLAPNFQYFSVAFDGKKEQTCSPEIPWRLRPGLNCLKIFSRNQLGISGPKSRIKLVLK